MKDAPNKSLLFIQKRHISTPFIICHSLVQCTMSNNTTALLIGIIFLFGLFAGGGAVILFSDSDSPIDNSEDDLNSGETIDDNSSSEETVNQVEDNN